MNLLQSLAQRLAYIEADPRARKPTPRVLLSRDAAWDASSASLKGSVEVWIDGPEGQETLLHRESLHGADTEEAVENRLAEALSEVLMRHTRWPS